MWMVWIDSQRLKLALQADAPAWRAGLLPLAWPDPLRKRMNYQKRGFQSPVQRRLFQYGQDADLREVRRSLRHKRPSQYRARARGWQGHENEQLRSEALRVFALLFAVHILPIVL